MAYTNPDQPEPSSLQRKIRLGDAVFLAMLAVPRRAFVHKERDDFDLPFDTRVLAFEPRDALARGTLLATLESLEFAGATVKDVVVVIRRGEGADQLKAKGYNIKTMVEVKVDEKRVTQVIECHQPA